MQITMAITIPIDEEGQCFNFEATVDVNSNEESEFKGREFYRLAHQMKCGMLTAQSLATTEKRDVDDD